METKVYILPQSWHYCSVNKKIKVPFLTLLLDLDVNNHVILELKLENYFSHEHCLTIFLTNWPHSRTKQSWQQLLQEAMKHIL